MPTHALAPCLVLSLSFDNFFQGKIRQFKMHTQDHNFPVVFCFFWPSHLGIYFRSGSLRHVCTYICRYLTSKSRLRFKCRIPEAIRSSISPIYLGLRCP